MSWYVKYSSHWHFQTWVSSEWRSKLPIIIRYKASENTATIFFCLNSPQTLLAGMNKFLSQLEITFRRDPNNYRPRINKLNSIKVSEEHLCSTGQDCLIWSQILKYGTKLRLTGWFCCAGKTACETRKSNNRSRKSLDKRLLFQLCSSLLKSAQDYLK